MALELCLTWVNRLLFLKLLEGQMRRAVLQLFEWRYNFGAATTAQLFSLAMTSPLY